MSNRKIGDHVEKAQEASERSLNLEYQRYLESIYINRREATTTKQHGKRK